MIRTLKKSGVTVILTTHYIQEAEELADRVGIINHGEILLKEDKEVLMKRLGKRKLILSVEPEKNYIPEELKELNLEFGQTNSIVIYTYDSRDQKNDIFEIMSRISNSGLKILDFETHQSSLEEIFVDLISGKRQ